jgi:hypothetical protein
MPEAILGSAEKRKSENGEQSKVPTAAKFTLHLFRLLSTAELRSRHEQCSLRSMAPSMLGASSLKRAQAKASSAIPLPHSTNLPNMVTR